ncbi:MAG TPA: hypothetical protein VFT34_08235, partial [Verrucomicrobiae bacterium]|nr:hypothetical protein [Verrucomicrobiae bacterium]
MSSLIPTKRGSLLFPALALLASLASFSATAAQVSYNFDDNVVPAGTTVNGVAAVSGGVLHLTDAGQAGVNGGFAVPDITGGKSVGNLHVHWKSLIGAGQNGGADGYSFNWGTDLAAAGAGEEGTGTGLSVTVDTFDNGGGETGIEIKWGAPDHGSAVGASRVAFLPLPKDDPGNGIYLRKNAFVEADLVVDNNSCRAIFTYDGQTVSADLPGFAGFAGGNFSFGARTGGANDNQWLDDVSITTGLREIVSQDILA